MEIELTGRQDGRQEKVQRILPLFIKYAIEIELLLRNAAEEKKD